MSVHGREIVYVEVGGRRRINRGHGWHGLHASADLRTTHGLALELRTTHGLATELRATELRATELRAAEPLFNASAATNPTLLTHGAFPLGHRAYALACALASVVHHPALIGGEHRPRVLTLLEPGHDLLVAQSAHLVERRAGCGQIAVTLRGFHEIGARPKRIGRVATRRVRLGERLELADLLVGEVQLLPHAQHLGRRIAALTHATCCRSLFHSASAGAHATCRTLHRSARCAGGHALTGTCTSIRGTGNTRRIDALLCRCVE
jgi:hypothetical protein